MKLDHASIAVAALEAVVSGTETESDRDPSAVYSSPDALFGIARPGVWAGEIERLLNQLPHRHRTALRRAAKRVAAEYLTPTPQTSQGGSLPPVVAAGKTWWVHKPDERRYLPCMADVLVAELQRSGVEASQGERLMTPGEAYRAHGVSALAVRWVYELESPRWSGLETRVLDLPGARVRTGRVEESPRVARWLELLGGSSVEVLLDWLATAPRLDRPTAALQLGGAADSVGKSLLVAGLTSWLGGVVSYQEATGEFGAELVTNPLVWLDEGVEDPRPDAFRRLTGNTQHRVAAKFRMAETLIGCPRLVITSNERDPLQFGEQELSSRSEDAIGQRILQIQAEPPAAAYLATLQTLRDGWAEPDGELVAHLRWLSDNRRVKLGKRWCVHGDGAAWVSTAHLRSGIGADLVTAYRAYCDEPELRDRVKGGPFLHDQDCVGVSTTALLESWRTLLGPQERVPSQQRLGKALRRLAGADPTRAGPEDNRGPRRYWIAVDKLTDEG